jgi:protein farnesyltransferase/geranylgeranyltransferase type-1 subunit alpha
MDHAEWAGPELSDVKPVQQDDDPSLVVSIDYHDDFCEVMDYFRALYFARELSTRALRVIVAAIELNPDNYTRRVLSLLTSLPILSTP